MRELSVDILRAARALIADRRRWANGGIAFDSNYRLCSPHAPEATHWSAIGALYRAGVEAGAFDVWPELEALAIAGRKLFYLPADVQVAAVNDRLGHEAVLAMFDRAIEMAEGQKETHQ